MIGLIAFFGTLWGRVAVAGGILAALIAAWAGFAAHYKGVGESRILAKIEKATAANTEKAAAARRSVEHIPAEQLNDHYKRD